MGNAGREFRCLTVRKKHWLQEFRKRHPLLSRRVCLEIIYASTSFGDGSLPGEARFLKQIRDERLS